VETCSPNGVGLSLSALWLSNLVAIFIPLGNVSTYAIFILINIVGIVFTFRCFRSTQYVFNYQTKEKKYQSAGEKRMLYNEEINYY